MLFVQGFTKLLVGSNSCKSTKLMISDGLHLYLCNAYCFPMWSRATSSYRRSILVLFLRNRQSCNHIFDRSDLRKFCLCVSSKLCPTVSHIFRNFFMYLSHVMLGWKKGNGWARASISRHLRSGYLRRVTPTIYRSIQGYIQGWSSRNPKPCMRRPEMDANCYTDGVQKSQGCYLQNSHDQNEGRVSTPKTLPRDAIEDRRNVVPAPAVYKTLGAQTGQSELWLIPV